MESIRDEIEEIIEEGYEEIAIAEAENRVSNESIESIADKIMAAIEQWERT